MRQEAKGKDSSFKERKDRALKLKEDDKRDTKYLVAAEVLFVLLPFFAIGTVFYFKGRFHELFTQPEWALAASVISGQAIVKCISGFLSMPIGRSAWQKVSLWITLAIVFSLTPSLLVLTLILNGDEAKAPIALVRAQIVTFSVGLIIFTFFSWFGENLRAEARYDQDTASARRGDTKEPDAVMQQPPSSTSHTPQPSGPDESNRHDDHFARWKQGIEKQLAPGDASTGAS